MNLYAAFSLLFMMMMMIERSNGECLQMQIGKDFHRANYLPRYAFNSYRCPSGYALTLCSAQNSGDSYGHGVNEFDTIEALPQISNSGIHTCAVKAWYGGDSDDHAKYHTDATIQCCKIQDNFYTDGFDRYKLELGTGNDGGAWDINTDGTVGRHRLRA